MDPVPQSVSHSGQNSVAQSGAAPFQTAEQLAKKQKALILRVVRFAFFTLMVTFTLLAVLRARAEPGVLEAQQWVYVIAAVLLIGSALVVDILTPNKKISTLVGVMLGVLAGLLASLAFGLVIDLVLESWVPQSDALKSLVPVVNSIKVLLGITLCYVGITTVLQTQDDFRLAIPYVEFVKQLRGARPMLIDTSALIDARIVDIAGTNLLQSPIVVPSFVVNELQTLADSGDSLKRARGRRGLDVVGKLQRLPNLDVSIDETKIQGMGVDAQLVELAQRFNGMIVTTDAALSRVAGIRQIPVLNLNDLAGVMRPNLVSGEQLTLKVMKPGEQAGQGVGYLPDGTMVVVEDGGHSIGQVVTITVGSALQTSAGRLIFGRVGPIVRAGEMPSSAGPASSEGQRGTGAAAAATAGGEPISSEGGSQETDQSNADDGHDNRGQASGSGDGVQPRTPFPPKPRGFRGGSPRNPRR